MGGGGGEPEVCELSHGKKRAREEWNGMENCAHSKGEGEGEVGRGDEMRETVTRRQHEHLKHSDDDDEQRDSETMETRRPLLDETAIQQFSSHCHCQQGNVTPDTSAPAAARTPRQAPCTRARDGRRERAPAGPNHPRRPAHPAGALPSDTRSQHLAAARGSIAVVVAAAVAVGGDPAR